MNWFKNMLSPEQRRIVGNEARQLLENRHFQEAFTAVDGYLNGQALACDADNKDKAQRIVISKQLLQALQREIVRKVEDGELATIEIQELERRNRPLRFMR